MPAARDGPTSDRLGGVTADVVVGLEIRTGEVPNLAVAFYLIQQLKDRAEQPKG